MQNIYYNYEVGSVSKYEEARERLILAIRTYADICKSCNSLGALVKIDGEVSIAEIVLCADADLGGCYTLSRILESVNDENRDLVKFFIGRIDSSTVVRLRSGCALLLENPSIDIPSDLLESALLDKAAVFTIPNCEDWMVDEITFKNAHESLVNIWGQNDIGSIVSSLEVGSVDPMDRLLDEFGCEVCDGAFSRTTFQLNEWVQIFNCFQNAKDIDFQPNDKLIKTFHLKYGGINLREIRLREPEIRFFFAEFGETVVLGGYFRKGHGVDENRQKIQQNIAGKRASQRIRNWFNKTSLAKA